MNLPLALGLCASLTLAAASAEAAPLQDAQIAAAVCEAPARKVRGQWRCPGKDSRRIASIHRGAFSRSRQPEAMVVLKGEGVVLVRGGPEGVMRVASRPMPGVGRCFSERDGDHDALMCFWSRTPDTPLYFRLLVGLPSKIETSRAIGLRKDRSSCGTTPDDVRSLTAFRGLVSDGLPGFFLEYRAPKVQGKARRCVVDLASGPSLVALLKPAETRRPGPKHPRTTEDVYWELRPALQAMDACGLKPRRRARVSFVVAPGGSVQEIRVTDASMASCVERALRKRSKFKAASGRSQVSVWVGVR